MRLHVLINDATTQLQGCPRFPWLKLTNGVSDVELLTKVTYKVRTDYHYRLISSDTMPSF